jgi:hypothetical protein
VSDPSVVATVVVSPPVELTLTMRRNGRAVVGIDFVDDGDAASTGGSMASDASEGGTGDGAVSCDPNTGSSCGSCGGVVQCDGSCSIATPSNLGQTCGSLSCVCHISILKAIDCSGHCVPTDVCSDICCGVLPC